MLNERSLSVVMRRRFGDHFQAPCDAERLSFAELIPSVWGLLTGRMDEKCLATDCFGPHRRTYGRVVLVLVDALGWNTVSRIRTEHPLFRLIETEGVLSLGTSMFPSTTTAHVTYAQTGVLPSESGLYEWRIQVPTVGLMVPLRFSLSGDPERDSLAGEVALDYIFPRASLFNDLGAQGFPSLIVAPRDVAESKVNSYLARQARQLPYDSLDHVVATVPALIRAQPGFSYVYINSVDAAAHRFGPTSLDCDKVVHHVLDRVFELILQLRSPDTIFVVTADHGQIDIRPEETLWLDKLCPELRALLAVNPATFAPLAPGGSIRDLFLHVKEQDLDHAAAILRPRLEGIAEVWKRDDLVTAGLFGRAPPSERFRSWVGNLVVLPIGACSIGWSEWLPANAVDYGFHGGLTAAEMQIPIGVLV